MSLEAFGVKNLRCLTDTGLVPIKPITLLVGRNSSGKSTFLRAFPLLKQSVENARPSPILWNHKDYVDFGTLDAVINQRATERSVTFGFATKVPPEWKDEHGAGPEACELWMEVSPSAAGDYVRSYDLRLGDVRVRLVFDGEHRLVALEPEGVAEGDWRGLWLGEVAHVIASLRGSEGGRLVYQPYVGTAHGWFQKIADAKATQDGEAYDVGPRCRTTRGIASVLDFMDGQVSSFMYGVTYLGPQRAVAERDPRLDPMAVEEVHARAYNLPNFLLSLSPEEQQSFARFTSGAMGFEATARSTGLRGEILVKESSAGGFVNIADVGFGYAEVLPLCTTLWASCVRDPSPKRRSVSLVALEQPELHLHPAHQAKLAALMANAWKSSREAGHEVKLMVETHSEGIINRMGDLIQEGKVSTSDVQIVFFDQDPETRQTNVRVTGYAEDGALREDWPFGFFAPLAD